MLIIDISVFQCFFELWCWASLIDSERDLLLKVETPFLALSVEVCLAHAAKFAKETAAWR